MIGRYTMIEPDPDHDGRYRVVTERGHPLGPRLQHSLEPLPDCPVRGLTKAVAIKNQATWEAYRERQTKNNRK